jgi:hypothetical protein
MATRSLKEFAMLKINTSSPRERLAEDLLWGVDGDNGIAAFLGIDARKCYYLIDRGKIPVQRLGHKTITASRRALRQLFSAP